MTGSRETHMRSIAVKFAAFLIAVSGVASVDGLYLKSSTSLFPD